MRSGVGVINLVMSENILGTVVQNYKKRVTIGSHMIIYVQRDPALKHFTLNGRTEVLLKSFWGQISGTFALKNLKQESD